MGQHPEIRPKRFKRRPEEFLRPPSFLRILHMVSAAKRVLLLYYDDPRPPAAPSFVARRKMGEKGVPRRRKLRILRFGLWAKSSVAPLCPTEIPLGDSASPQRTHFVGLRRGPFRAAPCIPVGFIGTGFDESARRVFALVLRPNFNQGAACHVVASSVSFVLAFGPKAQSLRCAQRKSPWGTPPLPSEPTSLGFAGAPLERPLASPWGS